MKTTEKTATCDTRIGTYSSRGNDPYEISTRCLQREPIDHTAGTYLYSRNTQTGVWLRELQFYDKLRSTNPYVGAGRMIHVRWQRNSLPHASRVGAAVCISCFCLFAMPAFASAFSESLKSKLDFNAVAPFVSATLHPKWTHMQARHLASRSAFDRCKAGSDLCPVELRSYADTVRSSRGKCRMEQLRLAHQFVSKFNRNAEFSHPHASDWLSPREFMLSGGNGADEAITKYYLLRDMGFAANDLRVVLAYEPVKQVFDAALTANVDGQVYVLQSADFYRNADSNNHFRHDVHTYEFAYAINEVSFWDYGSDRFGLPQAITM